MKLLPLILLSLLPVTAFAFFCPNNFNLIDFGDSIERVQTQCGKADKQEVKESQSEGPQEWTYFIPQSIATSGMTTEQGTLKTSIAFDNNGKVVNLSVNGIGVGSSNVCGSTIIQLGQTRDDVKAACGDPTLINKSANPATAPKTTTTKTTTLTYNTNPPVQLIFENGILTSKK